MRLRLFFAAAVITVFAAFVPTAGADVSSVVTGKFADPTPGAHSNYTNKQVFSYSGTPPLTDNDDLRKWVIDGPAGQIGNPNSIPAADRCTLAEFNTTVPLGGGLYTSGCPASSIVGAAAVTFGLDMNPATIIDANGAAPNIGAFAALNPAFTGLAADPDNADLVNAAPGTIYLLDNSPDEEIPVILATFFHTTASRTQSSLAPVTSGPDGDFRIRVIPTEDIPHRTVDHDADGGAVTPEIGIHVKAILQHLNGQTTGGADFLTNPTRCSDWATYSYATEYNPAGNTNADAAPVEGDGETYKKATAVPTTPDCSTKPAFPAKLEAKLSTTDRTANPQLDVVLTNSNTPGVDVPKDVTVKLPGAIAADIDAIAVDKLCTIAQRDSETCPASSKVGTVKVDTPFLLNGLTGNVYIVKKDEGGLPNLAIFVTGAIKFRLDGITNYVGPEGAEIETKLTNLPQALFSKFSLTIDGGKPDSLLVFRECPTNGSSPLDGPITSSMTGYTDAVVTGSDATSVTGCYGTPRIKSPKRCTKWRLSSTPSNLLNRANISSVRLLVSKSKKRGFRTIKTDKAAPFKFSKVKLSKKKFKKGKKGYFRVAVTYKPTVDAPTGKVVNSKVGSFKICR